VNVDKLGKARLLMLGVTGLVSLKVPAFAQSCALCYNNVAASKPTFIAGLRHGILILLFPPLAICLSIGLISYKKRNRYNGD
jgi:hypothetical protein